MTYKMIKGFPEDEYHALKALGSTTIKNMSVSPAYYQEQNLAMEGKDKSAFAIGSMFHQEILEPGRVEFIAAPELDRRTKEGKAAYAEFVGNSEGKTVMKKADFDNVKKMAEAFRKTNAHLTMMNGEVSSEVSIIGPTKKARFDLLKKHPKGCYIAYDLKTTSKKFPQNERDWQRWFIEWRYYIQAAWYIHVASLAGIEIAAFNFVLVSAKEPYEHAVVRLDQEWIDKGTEQALEAYVKYNECCEKNEWPGAFEILGEPVQKISMPSWGV